jgi:hypothetical protein
MINTPITDSLNGIGRPGERPMPPRDVGNTPNGRLNVISGIELLLEFLQGSINVRHYGPKSILVLEPSLSDLSFVFVSRLLNISRDIFHKPSRTERTEGPQNILSQTTEQVSSPAILSEGLSKVHILILDSSSELTGQLVIQRRHG